jgi:hypothetical protein
VVSHLDLFETEPDRARDLPVLDGKVPFFLRRKPRRPLVLVEQPACRKCGGVVGPLTRMCAACHFRGWWPPVA